MELNEFLQAFGNKVVEARIAQGISSRYKLAKKAKLKTGDISDIEEGRRNATLYTIRKLSIALEIEPDYFFRWK